MKYDFGERDWNPNVMSNASKSLAAVKGSE